MKRFLFMVITFMAMVVICSAQSKDEVTLVVSGDGPDKEEATKSALRSAIEQAYGTFVSANTTIVNDELTKDEIVTVSSGNIKSYEEISYEQLPDRQTTVTLKATVCISKLISYAKSKGASAEFAGAMFARNMKMYELNKNNERIAFENLRKQIQTLLPNAFDRYIDIGEPKMNEYYDTYDVEFIAKIKCNETTKLIHKLICNTLKALALSRNEIASCKQHNIKLYGPVVYHAIANANSGITVEDFENHNLNSSFGRIEAMSRKTFVDIYFSKQYFFRDANVLSGIIQDIANEIYNFRITDSNGNPLNLRFHKNGSSLARADYSYQIYNYYIPVQGYANMMRVTFNIPKDGISKYSGFKIKRQDKN